MIIPFAIRSQQYSNLESLWHGTSTFFLMMCYFVQPIWQVKMHICFVIYTNLYWGNECYCMMTSLVCSVGFAAMQAIGAPVVQLCQLHPKKICFGNSASFSCPQTSHVALFIMMRACSGCVYIIYAVLAYLAHWYTEFNVWGSAYGYWWLI